MISTCSRVAIDVLPRPANDFALSGPAAALAATHRVITVHHRRCNPEAMRRPSGPCPRTRISRFAKSLSLTRPLVAASAALSRSHRRDAPGGRGLDQPRPSTSGCHASARSSANGRTILKKLPSISHERFSGREATSHLRGKRYRTTVTRTLMTLSVVEVMSAMSTASGNWNPPTPKPSRTMVASTATNHAIVAQ
jgi:hypothetical protein